MPPRSSPQGQAGLPVWDTRAEGNSADWREPSLGQEVCQWCLATLRTSITQSARTVGMPSPGGRFENSPPFQGWECRIEASRPEGTAEFLPQNANGSRGGDIPCIQPSLRDLWSAESEPGSELPGYFQISLRETEIARANVFKTERQARSLSYFSSDRRTARFSTSSCRSSDFGVSRQPGRSRNRASFTM